MERFKTGDRVVLDSGYTFYGTVMAVRDFQTDLGTNQEVAVRWDAREFEVYAQDLIRVPDDMGKGL
jgi:preprotein translocase subunit YajC